MILCLSIFVLKYNHHDDLKSRGILGDVQSSWVVCQVVGGWVSRAQDSVSSSLRHSNETIKYLNGDPHMIKGSVGSRNDYYDAKFSSIYILLFEPQRRGRMSSARETAQHSHFGRPIPWPCSPVYTVKSYVLCIPCTQVEKHLNWVCFMQLFPALCNAMNQTV